MAETRTARRKRRRVERGLIMSENSANAGNNANNANAANANNAGNAGNANANANTESWFMRWVMPTMNAGDILLVTGIAAAVVATAAVVTGREKKNASSGAEQQYNP